MQVNCARRDEDAKLSTSRSQLIRTPPSTSFLLRNWRLRNTSCGRGMRSPWQLAGGGHWAHHQGACEGPGTLGRPNNGSTAEGHLSSAPQLRDTWRKRLRPPVTR